MDTADPAGPVTTELSAAITDLIGVDVDALDSIAMHDTVNALVRLSSRLDAVVARFVGPWDARGQWATDRSKSPATRLARDSGCAGGTARAIVKRARSLRTMPLTRAAFEAGEISTDRVDVLARANTPARAAAFAAGEAERVADATRSRHFDDFARNTRYWCDAADDASDNGDPEKRARRQRDGRHLDAAVTFGGTLDIRGNLDATDGEIFRQELARLEHQLFEADWAACREEWGPNATADKLARTATQRRADALVIMARRSARDDAALVATRPLISVLVDYPTFTGAVREFFNGTVLTPGQIASLLNEADVERLVFSGASRVIDVGTRTRLFTGATRRAVEVRDRRCTHPGCTVEAQWCQIDHIVEYCDGGPTTQDNGRLLCPTHNRQRPGRRTTSGPTTTDPP